MTSILITKQIYDPETKPNPNPSTDNGDEYGFDEEN